MSDHDDLAEMDTTPGELLKYLEEGEPARLVDPPAHQPIRIDGSAVTIRNNRFQDPKPMFSGAKLPA